MSEFFRPMRLEEIGSGLVNRRVTINRKERVRGDPLTHADIASIATANRNAMIENKIISVYPKHVPSRAGFGAEPTAAAVEGEFHVVAKGFGKYQVIRGTIMLADATKDAAAAFVADEQAKAGKGAQEAAAGPGNSPPKRQRRARLARPGKKRQPRSRAPKPPAPDAQQDNGPVGT